MPLSISNSDQIRAPRRLDHFTICLVTIVALVLVLAETVTRAAFDKTSKVQVREVAQRKEVLSISDSPGSSPVHLAVLGNSLMLDGIDEPLLRQNMGSQVIPVPYFVLGTEYVDWYFALSRLFDEGMRPRYVLLGLSPAQLASSRIKGDYSSRYLFRVRDLPAVARQTHMDLTSTSSLFLAHFSEFYGTREITRGYLISQAMPGVGALLHNKLGVAHATEIDSETLRRIALQRLAGLDAMCRAYGGRLIVVVPPTEQPGADIIRDAGESMNIPVLTPFSVRELDLTNYQDDHFHLNVKGAHTFTASLATLLQQTLAQDRANNRNQEREERP